MILIATLVMMLTMALLSMGVVRIALLQGTMSQTVTDNLVSRQAHASMLAQLVRAAKQDASADHWLSQARISDITVCLTRQGDIAIATTVACDQTYDAHHDIHITAKISFLGTQQDMQPEQWWFACMISVVRAATNRVLLQEEDHFSVER